MSDSVRQLEPGALWQHFADLNNIPRPSKKEERVIAFMKSFGQKLQLPTFVDEVGNVIIKKPATKGMEGKMTVVLQSHLDMVHQKNSDTTFDFDTQGIQMWVDGDWVKATGTTLGADNGIGVAAIMGLLTSTDIPHPALEALFTVDEETGMTGALALKGGLLDGQILLNLDTEEDNELTIGCAGGIDVTAMANYIPEAATKTEACRISLKGLKGGHSGVDIHKGRANANKLMNRVLLSLCEEMDVEIACIDGGSLRNAIPRESFAIILVDEEKKARTLEIIAQYDDILKQEYRITDPQLSLSITATEKPKSVIPNAFKLPFLRAVYACPNGIYRMSSNIEGLVQSSNNIARILVQDGKWTVQCLTRSDVDTEKMDLAKSIGCAFELAGGAIQLGGNYPGWTPRSDSPIVSLMRETYQELFNDAPHVNAIHAGLECGILGTNYPDIQMISFGPNIYGAHSPDEKVQISSVQKFWTYLLETLSRIPEKS